MNTKLTLNLDKEIINKAKNYAKNHKISLSKMVENYFSSILLKNKNKLKSSKKSSIVNELTGIINERELENYNDTISDYLIKKYK